MPAELLWQLHDARFAAAGDGYLGVITANGQFRLPVSAAVRASLDLLTGTGAREAQLALPSAGERDELERCLTLLDERGALSRVMMVNGDVVARSVPVRPAQPRAEIDATRRYRLSRFACARRIGNHMALESPTARSRVELTHTTALALLAAVEQAEPDDKPAALFCRLLGEAGLLTEVLPSGETAEDANAALRAWSFHDLMFHAGQRDDVEAPAAAPALKPPMGERLIPLPAPAASMDSGAPFSYVLDARRSVRAYDDSPISPETLGAFLYRAARVTGTHNDGLYEATRRPYPSAGALYPLELYVIANRCQSLPFGLYHYRPDAHQLEQLDSDLEALRAFAGLCASFTGEAGAQPQVALAITARMARVAWRYPDAALTLILEDIGVLMQTLYLVAADLDLAPCALGAAAPDLFARASGIDRYAEPQLGGFLLGVTKKS